MEEASPASCQTDPELMGQVDVLVVDDYEADRSSMAEILRGEGMVVAEAADGVQALDLLNSTRVGVMVLDVDMPRMSGPQLLAQLDDPPMTVLVTASAYDDKVLDQGGKITWFMKKPAAPPDLIKIVARCLHTMRGGPEIRLGCDYEPKAHRPADRSSE